MTFLKDLPTPDSQKSTVARIDSEWERLYKFKFHYWGHYIGYLFVFNVGGLLAILTHMGVSGIQAVKAGHKTTLLCFFTGIVLSLLLNVLLAHRTRTKLIAWEDDTGDFYDRKLGYEDLFKRAKELLAEAGSEFDTVGGCALVYWFVGVFSGWNAIF